MIWQSLRFSFLLTLTVAALLACSSASAAALVLNSIESGLNADNASDFSEDLKHELLPLVHTLQRPVKFYHYGNRGLIKSSYRTDYPADTLIFNRDEAIDLKRRQPGAKVNYSAGSELSPPEAGKYFLAMAAHFNKIQSSGWYVGPGLYGAVDPVQSESYMGKPWFLLEISAPRGLRYLDLRPEGKRLILSQSFIQKWVNPESGYELNSYGQAIDGRPIFKLKVNELLALPKLGQIFRAAMKELKIDAIAYAWLSSTISYCREVNHDEASAFNFMNDEGMARGIKLRVFTQELEMNASPLKKNAYGEILDLIEASNIDLWGNNGRISSDDLRLYSRILTHEWTEVLHRRHPLASAFGDVRSSSKLFSFLSKSNTDDSPLLLELSPSLKNQPKSDEIHIDPLKTEKAQNPETYQKRIKLIKSNVFGCNPEYPDEFAAPLK